MNRALLMIACLIAVNCTSPPPTDKAAPTPPPASQQHEGATPADASVANARPAIDAGPTLPAACAQLLALYRCDKLTEQTRIAMQQGSQAWTEVLRTGDEKAPARLETFCAHALPRATRIVTEAGCGAPEPL